MRAEQVTAVVAGHGEGVVHHPGWPGPRWVDMHAGDLLQLDVGTGAVTRAHTGDAVAAMIRPRRDGGLVVATRAELRVYPDLTLWGTEPEIDLVAAGAGPRIVSAPGERLNEGGCDPAGSVLVGGLTEPRIRGGSCLYRVTPAGLVDVVRRDVTVSNGLVFDAAGEHLFHIDTPTRTITRSAYPDGLATAVPFVRTPQQHGWPDGMCADDEGGLWVAMFGGGCVLRFDVSGRLTARVEVPVRNVTSCAFAGDRSTTLWITTSSQGAEDERAHGAGALFAVDVSVGGPPVLESAV